jgi:hypothetical protein
VIISASAVVFLVNFKAPPIIFRVGSDRLFLAVRLLLRAKGCAQSTMIYNGYICPCLLALLLPRHETGHRSAFQFFDATPLRCYAPTYRPQQILCCENVLAFLQLRICNWTWNHNRYSLCTAGLSPRVEYSDLWMAPHRSLLGCRPRSTWQSNPSTRVAGINLDASCQHGIYETLSTYYGYSLITRVC